MSTILEIIGHYQRSIERSQNGSGDSASNGKLLHCIDKLYRLPITVDHLQATGIGKTVNSLRKYDGEVGVAAKALVAKWKAMVTAEEYATETVSTANKTDDDEENDDDIDDDNVNDNNGGGIDDDDGGGGREYNDNEQKSNNNKTSDKKSESKHHRNQSSTSHKNDNSNKKSSTREHSRSSSSKSKHKSDRKDEKLCQNDFIVNESSSSKTIPKYNENLDLDNDEKLLKSNNDLLKNEEKHHHHSSSNSNSSNRDKNNKQHSSSSKHHHHHSRTDEKSSSKSSSSSSSKHRKEHHRDNHKSSSKDKNYQKSSSSGNASSNNINKNKENPNNNINRINNNNNKNDDNINKDNKRRHSITETITDGKSTTCEVTSSSSTTTTIISSSSSANKIKKPKIIHDEIDSTTGTSFEDALGMMIPIKLSNNSSNKNTIKIKSPNISKSNNNNSSSSTSKSSSSNSISGGGNGASSSSSSSKNNNTSSNHKKSNGTTTPNKIDCDDIRKMTPSLLTSSVNLKPLDPNIAIELPTISISNNYKPMPLNQTVMDCVFRSNQQQIQQKQIRTDAEALQHSISSKTMRTKVYSGQRSGQRYQPPKLFDLCIRFLQKNIDAIEYCGGYPYDILRHFLERATPSQLLNFEEWNQYIIEDTDELWQQHVSRHCRGQKRQEMESWREMYLRVKENEEHRLNMLAENIKQSQKLVAAPVKKTQLAFVDSMVKPPRNVQRKQDQFGTNKKLIATPAARVASLCNLTPNAIKTGDVRLRIAAGERDNAQVSGFIRPKKAPLMAKTLQLMKGRFKR